MSLKAQLESRLGSDVSLEEAFVCTRLAHTLGDPAFELRLSRTIYKVPLQNSLPSIDIIRLMTPGSEYNATGSRDKVVPSVLDSQDDRSLFPLKDNVMSGTKVNVFFRDVWRDAKTYAPAAAAYLSRNPDSLRGMYNDEASGWLIWFCGAWEVSEEAAQRILAVGRDYSALSDLSDALKSSGRGDCRLGRVCMEVRSLAGRGAAAPDPFGDVAARVDERLFRAKKSCGIGEEIRPYVRQVLREELASAPRWADKDAYWKRRWLYTKSGSHSRRIERLKLGGKLELPDRPTRREFAEAVSENLIGYGEPGTHAGQSWKLEHYKTRGIYSGDSVSYYTFEYLLSPVEGVWRNKRCLLDPGSKDQVSLYRGLSNAGDVKLMLDFEDYNSQHEKDAMRVVLEEACKGAPKEVLDWAIASLYNEVVYWKGEDGSELSSRTVGGLFSGHRGTTFFNTILNAAYCRMAFGDVYDMLETYHAGDDVISVGSAFAVGVALERFLKTGLRANKSKQGVGTHCGEFLRVSFTTGEAGGYFARSVASLVSGSWVTDKTLSVTEAAANYANMCWTLMVRSGVRYVGALVKSTFARRLPRFAHLAFEVVTGGVSVMGSPTYGTTSGDSKLLLMREPRRRKRLIGESVRSAATDDFIEECIPRSVLEEGRVTRRQLRRLMLEVSYKDRSHAAPDSNGGVDDGTTGSLVRCPQTDIVEYGYLNEYTVPEDSKDVTMAMQVLKGLVGSVNWESIFRDVFGMKVARGPAYDRVGWPVINSGTLGVAALSRIKNLVMTGVLVRTNYPVRV